MNETGESGAAKERELWDKLWFLTAILMRKGHSCTPLELCADCHLFKITSEEVEALCYFPKSPLTMSEGGQVTFSHLAFSFFDKVKDYYEKPSSPFVCESRPSLTDSVNCYLQDRESFAVKSFLHLFSSFQKDDGTQPSSDLVTSCESGHFQVAFPASNEAALATAPVSLVHLSSPYSISCTIPGLKMVLSGSLKHPDDSLHPQSGDPSLQEGEIFAENSKKRCREECHSLTHCEGNMKIPKLVGSESMNVDRVSSHFPVSANFSTGGNKEVNIEAEESGHCCIKDSVNGGIHNASNLPLHHLTDHHTDILAASSGSDYDIRTTEHDTQVSFERTVVGPVDEGRSKASNGEMAHFVPMHPTKFPPEEEEEATANDSPCDSQLMELNQKGGENPDKKSRHPKWSKEETLILLRAKRYVEEQAADNSSRKHVASYVNKWDSISAYCLSHGVDRSASECMKKWNNLCTDYKKIKDLEGLSGMQSYWAMSWGKRRDSKLHTNFDREVFDMMEALRRGAAHEPLFETAGTNVLSSFEHADQQNEIGGILTRFSSGDTEKDDHYTPSTIMTKRKEGLSDEELKEELLASLEATRTTLAGGFSSQLQSTSPQTVAQNKFDKSDKEKPKQKAESMACVLGKLANSLGEIAKKL